MDEHQPTLLIVDDDQGNREGYATYFARHPYRVLTASGGAEAIRILKTKTVDVVVTDLKMPDESGMEVVREASSQPIPCVTIVITAYATVDSAVEAMQYGAFDYLSKPVNMTELRGKVQKAFTLHASRLKNKPRPPEDFTFEGIPGPSQPMRDILEKARIAAVSRASVLIEGESGTGKELIARAIHQNSSRAEGPFVAIHCAALPESLIESELFGHEKGAFTGAQERRIGQFEYASGGTVFLDELSEIPLATQVKLLRVLEDRTITRVGSNRPIDIDIRLVAATNKNLEGEVKEGRFREDLYYRLNVVHLCLPPLRKRLDDLLPLFEQFLHDFADENTRKHLTIAPEVQEVLCKHPWYGNVRELRNVAEQIVVFAQTSTITLEDLPASLKFMETETGGQGKNRESAGSKSAAGYPDAPAPTGDLSLAEIARRHIVMMMEKTKGNRTRAARKLGISRRTLQRKLKELGLDD